MIRYTIYILIFSVLYIVASTNCNYWIEITVTYDALSFTRASAIVTRDY